MFAVTTSVTPRHPLWERFLTTVAAATQFYIRTPCKLSFTESLTVGVTAHEALLTCLGIGPELELRRRLLWALAPAESAVLCGRCTRTRVSMSAEPDRRDSLL